MAKQTVLFTSNQLTLFDQSVELAPAGQQKLVEPGEISRRANTHRRLDRTAAGSQSTGGVNRDRSDN